VKNRGGALLLWRGGKGGGGGRGTGFIGRREVEGKEQAGSDVRKLGLAQKKTVLPAREKGGNGKKKGKQKKGKVLTTKGKEGNEIPVDQKGSLKNRKEREVDFNKHMGLQIGGAL